MTRSPDRAEFILVHAYLDGELDPANALAIERRMAAEPALLAEYKRLEALQQLLRERFPHQAPSPELRARIEASVGIRPVRAQPSWRALAASIAVTRTSSASLRFRLRIWRTQLPPVIRPMATASCAGPKMR